MNSRWDIPKQKFLVEDGVAGDCWSCCVAAILNIPREEVPHFLQEERDSGKTMDPNTQTFLNKRGWVMIWVKGHIEFPRWGGDKGVDFIPQPIIECGPTIRSKKKGDHHAVVAINGELVYDPHPSEAGILVVSDRYILYPAVK